MAGPILSNIEAAMKTLIDGMTVAGGYNKTWGDSNEDDLAKKDAYPNAEIRLIDEENQDEIDGGFSSAYANRATFEVTVHDKLTSVYDNPEYQINVELNKCLDDLKKLFGINYHVSDTVNMIYYRGMVRDEPEKAGDIVVPRKMVTTWMVTYSQGREDPTSNAN